jgi:soluble lytic murein transglycosylase-like protein
MASELLTLPTLRPAWLVALALAVACPATASAQIYSWRDSNGTLVLSDRPSGKGAKTYAVRESPRVRSTRKVMEWRNSDPDYDTLIRQHASAQGVRPDLVRAVIQTESAFDPYARSVKGALGLMQLMPATAEQLGVVDPFNPEQNIRGGVQYLRQLLDRYDNNEALALAAYNAGPAAVDRYGNIPPYRETRNYVARIQDQTGVTSRSSSRIYRTVEIIDGRAVTRYSNRKPTGR